MTCRHLDHRLQPGRDLHSLYQGDILPALHPRQSPSVAHSDRNSSLWWSLSQYSQKLSEVERERRWLDALLQWNSYVQNGSLCLGLSQWCCSAGRLLQRGLHGARQQLWERQSVQSKRYCQVGIRMKYFNSNIHYCFLAMPVPSMTERKLLSPEGTATGKTSCGTP